MAISFAVRHAGERVHPMMIRRLSATGAVSKQTVLPAALPALGSLHVLSVKNLDLWHTVREACNVRNQYTHA